MEPFGEAAKKRILRHQRMRKGKGFETLECPCGLAALRLGAQYDGILLEDLGNLVANELFSSNGVGGSVVSDILTGIANLQTQCKSLVIVTNEVFSDGLAYNPDTLRYINKLGCLNAALAGQADAVYESVCGILVKIKGDALA